MITKIIFLDIDGTITSARTGWRRFDIFAVQFLNWVCEQTGAKIVISSSWRYNHPKEEFQSFFNNIHDDWKTDVNLLSNGSKCRGDEIQIWLNKHPETQQYLILDDDVDMLPLQMNCAIFTDSYNGLLWDDMEKITQYFSIDRPYNGNLPDLCNILAPLEKQIKKDKI